MRRWIGGTVLAVILTILRLQICIFSKENELVVGYA